MIDHTAFLRKVDVVLVDKESKIIDTIIQGILYFIVKEMNQGGYHADCQLFA